MINGFVCYICQDSVLGGRFNNYRCLRANSGLFSVKCNLLKSYMFLKCKNHGPLDISTCKSYTLYMLAQKEDNVIISTTFWRKKTNIMASAVTPIS